MNYRTPSPPVAWQPAAYLAALPPSGFTPAQDLALMEQAAMGHTPATYAKRQRLLVLLRAARNAAGDVAIDGQRALLDALRMRAKSLLGCCDMA